MPVTGFKKLLFTTSAPAVAAATFATWNPAAGEKSANITLSNGNLTLATSTASFDSVRATKSASSGKYYFEFLDVFHGSFENAGLANATFNVSGAFLGSDLNGIGYVADGRVFINNATVTTIQTFAQGDTICVATDLTNSKIWFRTNGGNWNNDVIGNQNPAGPTGGISISSLNAGPYFPTGFVGNAGDSLTANFGASAYAQTAPSGFGNW